MFNNFLEIISGIFVGLWLLFLVSWLVDLYFVLSGKRTYYTTGVLFFIKRITVNYHYSNIPRQIILDKRYHSGQVSSLIFTEIDPFSYGFHQEKFVLFKWIRIPDLMHGLLIFDAQNHQVVVKGFANYSVFALFFYCLLLTILLFVPFGNLSFSSSLLERITAFCLFVLFFWIMFQIQSTRFEGVALFAAQTWKRKYAKDNSGT